ncbi:hypothetical protein K1T71_002435 [Dendrolimus kikuchii]|uniref:Uncharacterized protein n=1 Tax=Dendrolimus kikuchii TaxID=765133 RepID=A0ACC1DCP8_9NEOP|nr:hypothetical protein K1T71_002435 [Dendrolimus kikuchii]
MSTSSIVAPVLPKRLEGLIMCMAAVSQKKTVRFWFQRFRYGNFDLQNKPRGRPETKFDNAELKAIVEEDSSQTTSEIAAGCGQLQTMMEKLAAKQPRLVNRSRPLLLQDNTRPHTAQQTATKLKELQLECLRHPPYSPDLFFLARGNPFED